MSLIDSRSKALQESATKSVEDSASKAVTGAVSNTVSNASNAVSGVANTVSGTVTKALTNVAVGAAVGAATGAVSGTVAKALTKVAVGAVAGAVAGAAVDVLSGAVTDIFSDSAAKKTESASEAKFTFEILESDINASVVRFTVQEEMSKPFMVSLTIACDTKISFDDVLGKEALLEIASAETGPRYVHGVIKTFRRAGSQGKYLYDATMVPYLDLLSMSTDCRIFQKMTVVEIVKKVFEPYKREIGTDKYKFLALKENGDKIKRRYCVQYRETDLDFISRILAEEGIFYYFEHSEDKHVIIFGDNTMNYKDISESGPIAFDGSSNMSTDTESISNFDLSHHLTTGEVTHSEYNFKNSSVKQKANANNDSAFNLEVYDYPGNYLDEKQGKTVSRIHLESLKTFEKVAGASSNAPRLSAGFIFKMDKGKDVHYLVTAIAHGGTQPQVLEESDGGSTSYSNSFTCIPATTIFRPVHYPRPVINGLQSAVVVGPKGEEIHTDEHGRVRVQFHWDRQGKRDENSSCWLRVAQSWGGGARGAQYIPRIGDEVMVSFLEGDPDRPVVTGSAYNSDNQPINNLKQSITQSGFKTKTHKGGGFHELRFDDANGREEIFMHSQKDLNMNVNSRRGMSIGGNSGTVIGGNCDTSVGGDHYVVVTGKQTGIAKEIVIGADTTISIVCGASSIVISPAGIKINGPRIDLNNGSSAPMPARRKVSGSQGNGGGGAKRGGGASKSSGSPSPKPAPQPEPAKPQKDWEVGPVIDREVPQDKFNGTVPGGGWGGPISSVSPSLPVNTSGLGTLPSLNNITSLKDKAIGEIQSKAAQQMGNLKGALLEKSGVSEMQGKLTSLSEKPAGLANAAKINTDDVIKKF